MIGETFRNRRRFEIYKGEAGRVLHFLRVCVRIYVMYFILRSILIDLGGCM